MLNVQAIPEIFRRFHFSANGRIWRYGDCCCLMHILCIEQRGNATAEKCHGEEQAGPAYARELQMDRDYARGLSAGFSPFMKLGGNVPPLFESGFFAGLAAREAVRKAGLLDEG